MMGTEIEDRGPGAGDQTRDDSSLSAHPPATDNSELGAHAGWSRPEPEHLSEPTYWPAVMALGIVLLLWGIVTSVIISIVGLALFALALTGWIGELLHENPEQ